MQWLQDRLSVSPWSGDSAVRKWRISIFAQYNHRKRPVGAASQLSAPAAAASRGQWNSGSCILAWKEERKQTSPSAVWRMGNGQRTCSCAGRRKNIAMNPDTDRDHGFFIVYSISVASAFLQLRMILEIRILKLVFISSKPTEYFFAQNYWDRDIQSYSGLVGKKPMVPQIKTIGYTIKNHRLHNKKPVVSQIET